MKRKRENHLDAVEQANEPVDEIVGLERLQLADREEVVMAVRVHEMGTISVSAAQHRPLAEEDVGRGRQELGLFREQNRLGGQCERGGGHAHVDVERDLAL